MARPAIDAPMISMASSGLRAMRRMAGTAIPRHSSTHPTCLAGNEA